MLTKNIVDSYRNKMRETIMAGGQEVSTVAPLYETRLGRRAHLERKARGRVKRAGSP